LAKDRGTESLWTNAEAVRLLTLFLFLVGLPHLSKKVGRWPVALLKSIAAVTDDQLTAEIGSGFGSERGDRGSDLVRAAGPFPGSVFACDDFVRSGGRGFDPARGNGIHRDSFAGNF
jgi:hypothetical protein